jgi:hypothetical protein
MPVSSYGLLDLTVLCQPTSGGKESMILFTVNGDGKESKPAYRLSQFFRPSHSASATYSCSWDKLQTTCKKFNISGSKFLLKEYQPFN